jgi:hypothetical protein
MAASAVLGEFGLGVVISGSSFVKIWMRGTVEAGLGMRETAAASRPDMCQRCCRRPKTLATGVVDSVGRHGGDYCNGGEGEAGQARVGVSGGHPASARTERLDSAQPNGWIQPNSWFQRF